MLNKNWGCTYFLIHESVNSAMFIFLPSILNSVYCYWCTACIPFIKKLFCGLHMFFWLFLFILFFWYILFYSIYIFYFLNFYCYSTTVVCLFSPSLHPTPSEPTSLPYHPPWFCPCVLYSSSCNPLSSLSPPYSPLAIVRLFLTSMSLVIFCLLFSFVDYIPVKGEIIWYLSLTVWLISLSIMLSSSIHAVAKGISSFFLSAV